MSVFDRSVQKDILKAIQRRATTGAIIREIVDEQATRATQMRNLYRRYKQEPCTNWAEQNLPLDFDGVPIYGRRLPEAELQKVNLRLHHPFDIRIVQTFAGYLSNDVSISIDETRTGERQAQQVNAYLQDFDKLNNGESLRAQLTEHAVRSGTGGALLYWNGDVRVLTVGPWSFVVIYDSMTGDPQYGLRWWTEKTDDPNQPEQIVAEWYDRENVSWYETDREGKFQPAARGMNQNTGQAVAIQPHLFTGHVPLIEFPKNPERVGDVELSLSLQDAYDIVISDLASELSQFRNSYLIIQDDALNIDREFMNRVRQTSAWGVSKDGKVSYLERNVNAEAHFDHAERLKENLFLLSNSVDFSKISGETRIMGLEMRMKPLDESARTTQLMFTTSLRRMYSAIADFARTWQDIEIDPMALDWVFTLNRPTVRSEEIDEFVATEGLMADIDRFKLLTFVGDPQAYVDRLEQQRRERAAEFTLPDPMMDTPQTSDVTR